MKKIITITGFIASLITIYLFASEIVSKCSADHEQDPPVSIVSSETTEHALENQGSTKDTSTTSVTPAKKEKISFSQKWKERKIRCNEKNGELETLWFFLTYFPGLNILFMLIILVWVMVSFIGDDDYIENVLGMFSITIIWLMPIFWGFLYFA